MKILDKYTLNKFLATLIFALVAFCSIFIIVDLIEFMDKFIDRQVPWPVVFQYYMYYLPYIVVLSFPVAILLASLFSVGQMARYNELTAMKASGMSLFRILLPLIILGFFISSTIMFMGEKIVPYTNAKKIDLYKEYVNKSKKNNKKRQSDIYIQLSEKNWLYIGYFDTQINTAHRVSVQTFDDSYSTIHSRIDAEKMVLEDDIWTLHNGITRTFTNNEERVEKFDRLPKAEFNFKSQELSRTQKKAEEMSYWELKEFINNIRRNGGNPDRWLVDLYLKIAFPFANFIILLFGAPLASRKTRSGPAVSFGISLFICFLYFGIIKVAQTFGHNGTLPPFLAAWLGNIIFGIGAVYILFKMRK
ncbi:MAG: LPS export ABC transporter permease LptG [candidate division KSB1 bacterium]|jgi:lipopolysaccharide export system permease protein|nr:LPS export ABC transporter permease LptG [candidate division KSB1 bacterium]